MFTSTFKCHLFTFNFADTKVNYYSCYITSFTITYLEEGERGGGRGGGGEEEEGRGGGRGRET